MNKTVANKFLFNNTLFVL